MRSSLLCTIVGKVLIAGVLATAQPATAQVLDLAVDASPAGLDPHVVTAFASVQIVQGTIYEGLTAVDRDLRVVPGLAEAWTVAPDGKAVSFRLRAGVTFHGGAPMTAEDAASSLRRVQSAAIASPLASRLASVAAITAKDDRTLELTLKEPSAPLLAALSGIAVVPKAVEADKDILQKAPDGTGPFRFAEWRPNGFIKLAKNEAYWAKGEPKLQGLTFNIVPESATRQVGLLNGQYALLPNIDAATALQLKGRPGTKITETLELAYTLIGMNTARAPFSDPRVREALNTAIDRDQIVQAALFGAGVAGGPLSPALKDWAVPTASFPCYKPDPARARALLKEAGVAMPVAVTLTVLPRQDIRDIAQVVQEQLNKAGFKVELRNVELGQFIQDWRNANFDLFASSNAGSVDPDDYFTRTFRTGGSSNVFKYANAELDGLLDKARASLDPAERKAAYDRVQGVLACQGPAAHLTYGTLFSAARPTLTGYEVMANRSLVTLRDATLGR